MPSTRTKATDARNRIEAGIAARAVLRQKYAGCWVAWAADTLDRVIASGKTWGDVNDVLSQSGIDPSGAVFEWIDEVTEIPALNRE